MQVNIKLVNNDTVGIFFEYSPKIVGLVKSLPGRIFDRNTKTWLLPMDGLIGPSIEFLRARCDCNVDNLVSSRLAEFAGRIGHLNALQADTKGQNSQFVTELPLYPFQKNVAEFMVKSGSCLNACFVGAGKTLTCLAVAEHLNSRRTLIIVPKSVLLQWAEVEGRKWLPSRKFYAVEGNTEERLAVYRAFAKELEAAYLVIGYETVRSDWVELAKFHWDIIVTDEAHRMANTATKTYRAIAKLKSSRRYALTATPVMNKAEDLYGIINWISPGALGTKMNFYSRYCVMGDYHGVKFYKNLNELALRCRPYIIKKTLEEVGLELPAKTETELPVVLAPNEETLYNQIRQELLFEIEKIQISKVENPVMLQISVVKLGKLFELCDSMELLGEHTTSSKLEVLKEHLESTLIDGQKAIIITRFSRMAEILGRELAAYSPEIITGATQNRQNILDRFNSPGGSRLLIGTEAISQGLNLQVANIMYNYDLPWNPARLEQRAGRIHRQGQQKPVFVYNLVVNKSVEKWLQRKIEIKRRLSETLLPRSVAEIKEILNG